MKRWLLIALLAITISTVGCGKKEVTKLQQEEESTMEETVVETVEETEEIETNVIKEYTIDTKNLSCFFAENTPLAAPIELTLVNEKQNGISDIEQWLEENQLSRSLGMWNQFCDEQYTYMWAEDGIMIIDKATNNMLYDVKIPSDRLGIMENCAKIQDGILYVGSVYNGYAIPNSCFLCALNLETGEVLWRSEDQTFNSNSFVLKDGVIICGYGFTSEPDYLYQIDAASGQVITKTKLSKMADAILEKDGSLYVHTYNQDLIFQIQ